MVDIKRISRKPKPEPVITQFDMLEVYVELPTDNPDPKSMVHARPFEFDGPIAIKYITTSPHSGQGFEFMLRDITERYGKKFVGCPVSGIGMHVTQGSFDDPFLNPIIEGKLGEDELDPDLRHASAAPDNDNKTVAEKIADGK